MSSNSTGAHVAPDTQPAEVDTHSSVYCVPVKSCCPDLLLGEECDCDAFAAEAAEMFRNPIPWDIRNRNGVVS